MRGGEESVQALDGPLAVACHLEAVDEVKMRPAIEGGKLDGALGMPAGGLVPALRLIGCREHQMTLEVAVRYEHDRGLGGAVETIIEGAVNIVSEVAPLDPPGIRKEVVSVDIGKCGFQGHDRPCGVLSVQLLVCSFGRLRERITVGKLLTYRKRLLGDGSVDETLDAALSSRANAQVRVITRNVQDHAYVLLGATFIALVKDKPAHDVDRDVVALVRLLDGKIVDMVTAEGLRLDLWNAPR